MTIRGRPGRRPAAQAGARSELLACSVEAFARNGYDGVSIRDLCDAAGVNVATVSYHFGSKRDLWESCIDLLAEGVAPKIAEMRDGIDCAANYEVRLRRFVHSFVDLNVANPLFGLFLHQEAVRPGERQAYVASRLIAPIHEIGVALLRNGMERGAIAQGNPSLLFFMAATSVASIIAGEDLVRSFETSMRHDELLDGVYRAALTLLGGHP